MPKVDTPSIELTTSLQTLYTVTGSPARQLTLLEIILQNHDTVSRLATVHMIPSGGSAGDSNLLIEHQSGVNDMQAGETRAYRFNLFKDPGSFLQAKASANSAITIWVNALEETP